MIDRRQWTAHHEAETVRRHGKIDCAATANSPLMSGSKMASSRRIG